MTKAEKNYRRDYGRKDGKELALNYSRDSLKEELDNMLETVNFDDLTADEKAYLNGRNQRKNHTLNIRFNDTEWEQICRQAELLKIKLLSANVDQIALRDNKSEKIYDEELHRHGIEYIYKPSNKYKLKFRTNGQERFTRAETPGEVHGGTHLFPSVIKHINTLNKSKNILMGSI